MPALSRSGSSGSSIAQRRKSHAAEHLHTLNLVERAAARSGKQWPAPPSPLPAALPAPSGGLRAPGAAVDVAAAWNFMDGVEEEEPAEEEEGQFWWDMNVNGVDGVDGDALWEKSAPKRKSGSWEEEDFTWWWS